MLENGRPATREVVKHIDRCLSCLACMTTCPSGVHYMHLVDHARAHIEKTYRRPLLDRAAARAAGLRAALSRRCSALALRLARLGQAVRAAARRASALKPLAAMLRAGAAPHAGAARRRQPQRAIRPHGARRGRVALLAGCAQPVLGAGDQRGAIRAAHPPRRRGGAAAGRGLLRRAGPPHGPRGARRSRRRARNIDAWTREIDGRGPRRHPDHGLRLRHDGQGLRLHAAQRSGLCRRRPRASRRWPRTSANIWPRSTLPAAGASSRARRRLSLRLLAAARPEDHARSRRSCLPSAGFMVRECRKGICAAARPAPTTFCSRRSRDRLRDRKVGNIEATRARCDRRRQYRLHHADRRGHGHAGRPHGRTARLGDRRAMPAALRASACAAVGRLQRRRSDEVRNGHECCVYERRGGLRTEPQQIGRTIMAKKAKASEEGEEGERR